MGDTSIVERPEHTQVWFGPESRPLYGWVARPAGGVARGGAILCPPMGEEGRAAHRTFRRLAEELADAGIVALRFDYDGTGDSAGLQDDPDRVPRPNLRQRRVEGKDFGVHREFPQAARNQLRELRTEIEDDDGLVSHWESGDLEIWRFGNLEMAGSSDFQISKSPNFQII